MLIFIKTSFQVFHLFSQVVYIWPDLFALVFICDHEPVREYDRLNSVWCERLDRIPSLVGESVELNAEHFGQFSDPVYFKSLCSFTLFKLIFTKLPQESYNHQWCSCTCSPTPRTCPWSSARSASPPGRSPSLLRICYLCFCLRTVYMIIIIQRRFLQ